MRAIDFDRWPADGTELLIRLLHWWSKSTWLVVEARGD
jgi:hypothetical protein